MAQRDANHSAFTTRFGDALKTPRARRFGLWFGAFVVLFGVFGYFAAPPLLKSILLKQLSAELRRDVSIERIDINPYALSARVSGVSVKAEGGREVFGFDELFLNLSSASLVQWGVVVDEIRLRAPRLAVARVAAGRYDISDLLEKWMAPSPPSPTPRFSLNNIELLDGKIEFDDRPLGKLHRVTDIHLALPFLSSLPYQAEITVEPRFSATAAGAPVVLAGRGKPFSASRESELNLDIDHLDIAGIQAYLPESLPFRLQHATVDSELKLLFKELPGQVFSLSLAGRAHLSGLAVSDAGGQPLLAWKRLDVDLADADLINQRFAVQRVSLDGLEARVEVSKQGELNWQRIADQLAAKPATAAAPRTVGAPAWQVDELRLSNGVVRWKDASNASPVLGELRAIQLTLGKLDSTLAEPVVVDELSAQLDFGERLKVEQVRLRGIKVDLARQRLEIDEIANHHARIAMLRNKDGRIDWIKPPVLKTAKAAGAEKTAARPWLASVGQLAVDALTWQLDDQTTSPAARQVIDDFSLRAEGLSSEPGKPGKLSLKTRINQKGGLQAAGSLQLTPLAVVLQVDTLAIPMLPLQPYFTERLNISLTRGQLSSSGELAVDAAEAGLNARYTGSLTLGDLLAVDKLNNADFLKWKSLYVGGIDFQLQPMAVNVGEVALTDFYSRLIVGPAGQLNLANMLRKPPVAPDAAGQAAVPEPVAGDKPVLPIKIAKVTLQGGTVNFSDFFVKPNYSANLTQVGGRVTGLSSAANTIADMELRGRYANAAPVTVQAKLNPLASPSFLDLKAEVSGVDLVPFSPYSGKYAGYNINKGKLSLNVAYKLENGRLAAENRLFVDQLTFGDKVESPDATTLPVNLAISLLKNNRGEIDLNLPIAGSLDDPQFSVGGLIVKVIVNLFTKAVTSPFALLGSMFAGGEELSMIDFAPGRDNVNEAAGRKLEALARALNERDALKLEITGRADPEADKEGLKWVAIQQAVRAEKQKEMIKMGSESGSLDSIEISDAEYPIYLQRAYKEAKFPKPRNVVGLHKALPREEMEKLLLTHLPATPDDIRQLAIRRAERVEAWLLDQGKVGRERIFLLPPKLDIDAKAPASRVDFSLR